MINLYDEEIVAAGRVVAQLTYKYGRRTWSNLNQFNRLSEEIEKDATSNLYDIGLIAVVNTTPMLAGQPPVIEIQGRLNPTDFDHEKKGYEVRKARELGETIHGETKLG